MKLIFATTLLATSAVPQVSHAASQRSVVTISLEVNKKEGDKRVYSIPVKYKSKTLQSLLDSGSTPLLVLSKQLPTSDYVPVQKTFSITYGGTRTFEGNYVSGSVAIGAASGPVTFGIVTQVFCDKSDPNCVIKGKNATDAYFGGFYPGISGVRISSFDNMNNDLYQLGVRRYIIVAPRINPNVQNGELILNPTTNETSTYVPLVRTTATNSKTGETIYPGTVRGCLQDKTRAEKVCGAVLLDTGNTGITILQNQSSGLTKDVWSNGDASELTFTDAYNREVAGVDFKIGANPIQNVGVKTETQNSQNIILIGQLPYLGLRILTDFDKQGYSVTTRTPLLDGTKGHVP